MVSKKKRNSSRYKSASRRHMRQMMASEKAKQLFELRQNLTLRRTNQ